MARLGESFRNAAGDDSLDAVLGLLGLATLAGLVFAALRQIWAWVTRAQGRLEEDKRAAERACADATAKLKQAEARVDTLRGYDPQVFMTALDTARAEGVIDKPAQISADWLKPLRPALAQAWAERARGVLAAAPDVAGSEDALRMARAGFAADPQDPLAATTLAAAEEARSRANQTDLSDEERAAWDMASEGVPIAVVKAGQRLLAKGRYHLAQILLQRGWDRLRQTEGPEGLNTLSAKAELAGVTGDLARHADALALFEQVHAVQRRADVLGEEHPNTLTTQANIAKQMGALGRHSDALALFEQVYAVQRRADVLGKAHPDTLKTQANIAKQMSELGRHSNALALFEQVYAVLRRADVLGKAHPDTLNTQANIASQMGDLGRHADALALFEQVYAVQRRADVLGEEHPNALTTQANIAKQMSELGRHSNALALFEQVYAVQRRADVLGEAHPGTLNTQNSIAFQMGELGRHSDALALFEQVYAVQRRADVLGEEHPNTLLTQANIASQMGDLGRHADALALFEQVYAVQRRADVLGEEHPNTLLTQAHGAMAWALSGGGMAAVEALHTVWETEVSLGHVKDGTTKALRRRMMMGRCLRAVGDMSAAAAQFEGVRKALLALVEPTHYFLRDLEVWQTQPMVAVPG